MTKGIKGSGPPKPCGVTWEVPTGAVTTVHKCGVDTKGEHPPDGKGGKLHVCRRDNCNYAWPVKEKISADTRR